MQTSCPILVAIAAPLISILGNGPIPKIRSGSKIIFVIEPAIILNIVTFIFPTDWKIFSNPTFNIIISEKANTILLYSIPSEITFSE